MYDGDSAWRRRNCRAAHSTRLERRDGMEWQKKKFCYRAVNDINFPNQYMVFTALLKTWKSTKRY